MPRKKDSGNVKQAELEISYKTKIRFKCPKRGWVEEEIEVKRYKAATQPEGTTIDTELDSATIFELY